MESVSKLQQSILISSVSWLEELRASRRFRNAVTLSLVILGPLLVVVTFLLFGGFESPTNPGLLQAIILVDLIYVLIVTALVARQVSKVIMARRRRSAGSKLHLRLTGVFTITALIPTVLVAVFATLTLNFGLEGWFSERVRQVLGNSLLAAQAYESEHRDNLDADARLLASYLDAQKRRSPLLSIGDLREFLNRGQLQMQRTLSEAYVINASGKIVARGENSYLFDFEQPSPEDLLKAMNGELVIIEDWDYSEFRALFQLSAFADRLLYVTRDVDGEILKLLDETQETVALYNQLESERGRLLFEFAIIYLGFALIVILAAVWFGMWFAERLSRPVGRLAGAAEKVGSGNLDVRVIEEKGDDEIAVLGRVFNRMIGQLGDQRNELLEANAHTERRRRLFDSVLSGVTAGVIGLDSEGRIEFLNEAAERMLEISSEAANGRTLAKTVPEFKEMFSKLGKRSNLVSQGEVEIIRADTHENLLVRMSSRRPRGGVIEGYVITFDDVTDLVSAQRMAAWGDVARRIAHEIKNPLTPIQLSAERLKRKFGPLVGEERDGLEQYSNVIIRQTEDLRRIVDEFSKFARMPAPEKREVDISDILKGVVLLQDEADKDISVHLDAPDQKVMIQVDPTLIGQAFTNLVKNAREAVTAYKDANPDIEFNGEVQVLLEESEQSVTIFVNDNGIGLPPKRSRLFEPYVTNREDGTGLGLSIVKKIVEDHDGHLDLLDAPVFDGCSHKGASARMVLPRTLGLGSANNEDPKETES